MQEKLRKKAGAFKTIREVADHLGVEQHVLRFWETKFSQIKPMKRGGGRRYYRPEDVSVLERVHELLYKQKYTIKGAQKVMKGNTRNQIANVVQEKTANNNAENAKLTSAQRTLLKKTLSNLKKMQKQLSTAV